MSHFQWCHLFNKTTKFPTFPTVTPFNPGLPGSPGTPVLPFSPLRPTGPVGPISPFCPLCPIMPNGPWSPFGPRTPGGPGSPVSPGKPCNWGRTHDIKRKPGFYKLALIAWNRALSRRSWSLILQFQRLDRLYEMNDGVIVIVIVIVRDRDRHYGKIVSAQIQHYWFRAIGPMILKPQRGVKERV